MALKIDHIFVLTAPGAPEADSLLAIGLTEGTPNRHPGQGTANRRVFFQNTMLEFLWVEREEESKSRLVENLGLWDRWFGRGSGACPFGICIHGPSETPPFDSWVYSPPYLPSGIHIARSSCDFSQPFLFYFAVPKGSARSSSEPHIHDLGLRELTSVRISGPAFSRSPDLETLSKAGVGLQVHESPTFFMELSFDGEASGEAYDACPQMPIRVSW